MGEWIRRNWIEGLEAFLIEPFILVIGLVVMLANLIFTGICG